MEIIPKRIRKLWSDEEIRLLVLFSLFLQIMLISFSLFRKRSTNKLLSLVLWLSYLGADAIAILALGNLLNQQNDAVEANTSGDIMAFWTPFLLLHLGGPDTITSYSLEDNELWLRHLLNLVVEVVVAVFVFLESLPNPHIWKPAIVVFTAGILKYAERTLSLRSASMEILRDSMIGEADPGPDYAKFMQEFHSLEEAGVKVSIGFTIEAPTHRVQEAMDTTVKVISMGYHFFQTFKKLTVDLMLSFQDRFDSREFFVRRNAEQAFQVVEVELSFLHDILHTKAVQVHRPRGRIIRLASLAMAVLAFLLFYNRSGKDSDTFKSVDVLITYLLLLVAIGLEIVAILLLIFSDWTIVALQMSIDSWLERPWIAYIKKMLRTPQWGEAIIDLRGRLLSIFPEWLLGDTKRWWSNKMRQHNLLRVCIRDYNRTNLDRMLELLKLKDVRNQLWYVSSIPVDDVIKRHIFDQLTTKIERTDASDKDYLRASRGEWVLREKGYSTFKWSVEKEFDESLLIWHIATYLCYKKYKAGLLEKTASTDVEAENEAGTSEPPAAANTYTIDDYIKISLEISEYLMYLVVYQPKLLPAGIGTIRFIDTCAEAKKFFSDKETEMREELQERRPESQEDDSIKSTTKYCYFCVSAVKNSILRILRFLFFRPIGTLFAVATNRVPIRKWWTAIIKTPLSKKIHQFFCFCIDAVKEMVPKNKLMLQEMENLGCKKLMEVSTTVNPSMVKGDRSKSVLFDGVNLARVIMDTFHNEKMKWEVISSVLAEMLCYAADNCASSAHARQLSQGGELLTHVWLLMAHMGFGEQYRINTGRAQAKLVVETLEREESELWKQIFNLEE